MAVISVKETFVGRDAEAGKQSASLLRQFIVQTDDVRTAQRSILSDPRIPARNSYYTNGLEVDTRYSVSRVTPRQGDTPYLWNVAVEYEAITSDEQNNSPIPWLQTSSKRWSTGVDNVEILTDAYGRVAKNTLGDPFDPAPQDLRPFRILHLTRREQTFSATAMDEYVGTVCRDELFGYEKLEARMMAIDATEEVDPDYGPYKNVTYEIHFRKTSLWQPTITNYGRLIGGAFSASSPPGPWATLLRNVGWRYRINDSCDPTVKNPACIVSVEDGGFQSVLPEDLDEDGTKLSFTDKSNPYWIVLRPLAKSWDKLKLESR